MFTSNSIYVKKFSVNPVDYMFETEAKNCEAVGLKITIKGLGEKKMSFKERYSHLVGRKVH